VILFVANVIKASGMWTSKIHNKKAVVMLFFFIAVTPVTALAVFGTTPSTPLQYFPIRQL